MGRGKYIIQPKVIWPPPSAKLAEARRDAIEAFMSGDMARFAGATAKLRAFLKEEGIRPPRVDHPGNPKALADYWRKRNARPVS